MTDVPSVKGDEVVRALGQAGFEQVRQRGSHVHLKHSDGRRAVVPVHRGMDIDRGLLRKVLRDCAISVDEFVELLRR